jgi:serine/threonine protein kinase
MIMSSQESHRPASVKNSSLPSTPVPLSTLDSSDPLTPDTIVLVNPFSTDNIDSKRDASLSLRQIGNYELSETKFDDFKCARHVVNGEAHLYKEYPLETLRQRLEPYQRLTSLLLASHNNRQRLQTMSLVQLAAKYHLHFFCDIVSHEQTAIVIYPIYTSNLHTYITDRHRLNEQESKGLFTHMVRAIKMCHHAGLIVRDLKLRKLIFSTTTHTHLLLTGLDDAIMLSSPMTTDDFVSSRFSCPVYACPEIVLNRQMYSGKMADSWSLGRQIS